MNKVTVTSLTASRMLEIENASVVRGFVDLDGNLLLETHGGEQINAGNVRGPQGGPPPGTISTFAGTVAPEGAFLCDGRALSRTDYPTLFNVIGTRYGAGDGSTTFNIPNLLGKVVVGVDPSDADFASAGKTGGEKTHILTEAEMPSHTHVVNPGAVNTSSAGDHSHRIQGGDDGTTWLHSAEASLNSAPGANWAAWFGGGYNGANNVITTSNGAHTHSVDIPATTSTSAGGGKGHNNLQPYMALNYIIFF